MKQTGKRLFAVLLTIALCLSLFPVMASAEDDADTVTIINSLSDITNAHGDYTLDMSGNYKLGADITITKPIGSAVDTFNGTFDGDGHTVTISISESGDYVGMFAYIGAGAVVKNFTVDTATVTNDSSYDPKTGAIAGTCNGTISNVRVLSVDVTSIGTIGGLVGYLSGTVTQCSVDDGAIKIKSTADMPFGSIVGENYGTVSLCSANVTMDHSAGASGYGYTGGLVGRNQSKGTITDCYFTGSFVESPNRSDTVGGICARNNGTITNCHFFQYGRIEEQCLQKGTDCL